MIFIFNKLLFKKYVRKKIKILLFIILLCLMEKNKILDNNILGNNLIIRKEVEKYELNDILNFNYTIKKNTILIFEPHAYHYECSPGYAKYFIDLGFNVDILMHKNGSDSFCLFQNKEKIRLFLYYDISQINSFYKNVSDFMNQYTFIFIQTISEKRIETISKLDLLNKRKVIYVFHFTYYYDKLNFSKIENQNRIWTLGHFSIGLQVVPYYVGDIKLKDKNKKTRFFTVSTISRNYNFLVSAAKKLKNENLDFQVVVVGKVRKFSSKNINKNLKANFLFNYRVNFETLYKMVDSSDYIILTLDNKNKKDKIFKDKKVTGAAQLSYGFVKPALINSYFKDNYNMTEENSFIFNKSNFYSVMKKAILLNNKNYKLMQKNLLETTKLIYNYSIRNIQKTLDSILINL